MLALAIISLCLLGTVWLIAGYISITEMASGSSDVMDIFLLILATAACSVPTVYIALTIAKFL
jgi:hypothetical protein